MNTSEVITAIAAPCVLAISGVLAAQDCDRCAVESGPGRCGACGRIREAS